MDVIPQVFAIVRFIFHIYFQLALKLRGLGRVPENIPAMGSTRVGAGFQCRFALYLVIKTGKIG